MTQCKLAYIKRKARPLTQPFANCQANIKIAPLRVVLFISVSSLERSPFISPFFGYDRRNNLSKLDPRLTVVGTEAWRCSQSTCRQMFPGWRAVSGPERREGAEVMARNAADVLVEGIIDWGVNTVFGLPGDGINGIMEALRQDRIGCALFKCATLRRQARSGSSSYHHRTNLFGPERK